MAQYIQKPGGTAVLLSSTDYATLQDAANQGYSPVSAPKTSTTTSAPAPISAPTVTSPSSGAGSPSDSSLWTVNPASPNYKPPVTAPAPVAVAPPAPTTANAEQVNQLYQQYYGRNAYVGGGLLPDELGFWTTQPLHELQAQLDNDYKKSSGIRYDYSPILSGQQYTQNQISAKKIGAIDVTEPIETSEITSPSKETPAPNIPGSLIINSAAMLGLTESDIARTTGGNIYHRDLAREQSMMSDYISKSGAPTTDNDWKKFHDFVYEPAGTTGGGKGEQGKATFITYNPKTGTASNRRPLAVGSQGANDFIEIAIPGGEYSQNPDAWVVTSKDGNTLYGFKKPVTGDLPASAAIVPAEDDKDTITDTVRVAPKAKVVNPILTSLHEMFADTTSQMKNLFTSKEDAQDRVEERMPIVNELKGELDQLKNELDYNQVLQTIGVAEQKEKYYAGKQELLDRGQYIPMGLVNGQLSKLADEINVSLDKESLANAVANATNTYRYNSKLIEYNIALGDLQNAQQVAKDTAADIYNYQNQMLNIMQMQNTITQQDRGFRQEELDREYEMAMNGYTYVSSPSALQKLAVDKGLDWIKKNTIKIGEKIYVKPDTFNNVVDTIVVDGRLWGINAKGEKMINYGRSTNFQFSEDDNGNIQVMDPATGEVRVNYKPVTTSLSIGDATITGMNGSELWSHGLDLVLDGGKGAMVKSPFIGEIIFSGENEGFGNQVKIALGDGTELWLSHLDEVFVDKGDFVNEETIVGTQGNTGDTYSLTGGDGTHLDITMKKPDGGFYKPHEVASFLGYNPQGGYEESILVTRLGKQIYGTRISNDETARVQGFVDAGTALGKTQWEIIDDVIGYQIEDINNKPFADNIKSLLLQNTGESGLAGFDMLGLARLINNGQPGLAVTKAENMVYKNARSIDPEGFISESKVKTAIEKANELAKYIDGLGEDSPVGIISGTIAEWLGKLKSKDATTIKAKIVNMIAKMQNELLGSAITEAEQRFLAPIIPSLNDTPANFIAKIEELQENPLLELNNYRSSFGLPELSYNSLFNKNVRASLYVGDSSGYTISVPNQTSEGNSFNVDAGSGTLDNGIGYTIE